jgi:hypothetical protein
MSDNQRLKKAEMMLTEVMEAAHGMGVQLITRTFAVGVFGGKWASYVGSENPKCCLLGAYCLVKQPSPRYEGRGALDAARLELAIDEHDAWQIVYGWDNQAVEYGGGRTEWWELGRRLHQVAVRNGWTLNG